jgi:hypothetical protein
VNPTTACRRSIAASALLFTGCFSYVAAPLETVPAGTDVRVYVTRQALADLSELLDPGSPVVRGTLVRREDERVFIRVPVAPRQQGFYVSTVGQDVILPAGEIVQLERRRLDRTGTALLVGGTAVSAAVVVVLIMDAFGRPGRGEPPTEEIRIPLFSFSVR